MGRQIITSKSYMKNIIIVTGGAGFIGSNLIKYLLKKTKYKIISIDNYSTGSIKNHVRHSNVRYIKDYNINIFKVACTQTIPIIPVQRSKNSY